MENYGDFCGFKFNGHHSSEFGLIRVTKSNRYNDNLVPTFKDTTVEVPGGNGTYYFDSKYTQRSFSISVAFDSVTESQLRLMRQVFNGTDMGDLIFDEAPYKAYKAKIQSAPQLTMLCFDSDGGRVYKGEGTFQFICYDPFAHSVHKFLDEYTDTNKSEWAAASGLLETQGGIDVANSPSIQVYNAGDIDVPFEVFFPVTGIGSIYIQSQHSMQELIMADSITAKGSDTYLGINSKTKLVRGYTQAGTTWVPTGNLYNEYVLGGEFLMIPAHTTEPVYFYSYSASKTPVDIKYDYLYY